MAGYYFSLPQITQLTISQQAALNETKQIALSGGPGTGKSVVSLWRHLSNHQNNTRSLLLTFTTTLAKYLSACCIAQNPQAADNIKTLLSLRGKSKVGSQWNEIIVDEAQDLPATYYEDIKRLAPISYGADDSQILYPNNCSKQDELKLLFGSNVDYVLDKNFRSTQRIMQFAKILFPDAYIPQATITGLANNVGELPIMIVSGKNNWNEDEGKFDISNSKQNKSIIEIINTFRSDLHNIAILVPFKNDAQAFDKVLNENNIIDFSIYYDDRVRFPLGCEDIKNVHITTFKSAKGLEFDTVIIPNFDKYKNVCGAFNTEWQDYYVAVTRARSNLYIISSIDLPQLYLVTDKSVL